jgi:ABC-type branched-subunit amino acid transport system substrate-binding protein
MKVNKISWVLALAACLVMGLAAAAPAEMGVTATEIRMGQWGPQTGPAAPWGSVARGTGVLFDMVNAAGGIGGRKIKYYMFDDRYNPALTRAGVIKLVEGPGIFAFVSGVGTTPGLSVMNYLMKKKIIWFGPATGSRHWAFPAKKYLFGMYPNYPDEAKALTRYAIMTMKKKRLAFFYQNDDYGKGGLKGFLTELKRHGLKPAALVPVERGVSNLVPHCRKLARAKADAVIMWVLPRHAVILKVTAHKLGFKPTWFSSSTLSDTPFMYKISRGLWAGTIFANFAVLPHEWKNCVKPGSPECVLKQYHQAYKKFAKPGERWGVFFYAGMGFVEPLVYAMKKCGRKVSRACVIGQLDKLKGWRGIMGPVTFGPMKGGRCVKGNACRQGQRQVFLAVCLKGGKAKKLTGWIQP